MKYSGKLFLAAIILVVGLVVQCKDDDPICTSVTYYIDADGDGFDDDTADFNDNGIPDYLERDRDGDGIFDYEEDEDDDGIPDYLQGDANGDGILDYLEDEDCDGIPDYLDEDADGDGIDDDEEDDEGLTP